jgi:hypothetical protein
MDDNIENPEQSSQPPQPAEETSVEQDKDARKWAMFTHLSAFAGIIGIPFGWLLGPLILWLIKKDDFSYVNRQGKEALNFQISMTLYALAATPLLCIGLAVVIWPALAILDIVFVIIAAIRANDGKDYQYPITIRFVK